MNKYVHFVRWRGDRWMCALCEREREGGDVDVSAFCEIGGGWGRSGLVQLVAS